MRELSGTPVSDGIVYSKAYVFRHDGLSIDYVEIDPSSAESEFRAFSNARDILSERYSSVDGINEEARAIMDVHLALLNDPEYEASVYDYIFNHNHNAAWAVEAASNTIISILEASEDEYLRDRAFDMKDLRDKLAGEITGMNASLDLDREAILIADYLLPTEMLSLKPELIKGIALESGGKTSHIAILAKSLSIPAVMGLKNITRMTSVGDDVILDGIRGVVVVTPGELELEHLKSYLEDFERFEDRLHEIASSPSATRDGRYVTLKGNAEGLEGLDSLIKAGAEGIGLFRTEFLLLQKELRYDEEKKAEIYRKAAEMMLDSGDVIFRTLDIGGDKSFEGFAEGEKNPFLGCRSIRFCMENKDIFHRQLVSILKASALGNVRLMFPMISGPDELQTVLEYLESVKEECRDKGIVFDENLKVGTMIEVPSAALTSDVISGMVDFMSIGTNDLIQYTIAVDRGNDKVASLYQPLHPAVLRLMKFVADNAKKKGIGVSICGEMAGEIEYLPLLIGLGFEELSMSAHSILMSKERMGRLDYRECRELAERLLSLNSSEEIEKELKEFNGKIYDGKA